MGKFTTLFTTMQIFLKRKETRRTDICLPNKGRTQKCIPLIINKKQKRFGPIYGWIRYSSIKSFNAWISSSVSGSTLSECLVLAQAVTWSVMVPAGAKVRMYLIIGL